MRKLGIPILQAVIAGLVVLLGSQLCRTTPLGAQADPPVADIVKAKSFQLVDDAGRTRIEMAMYKTHAGVSLYNEKGVLTLYLSETPDGSAVTLANPITGNQQITLSVGEDAKGQIRPYFFLWDENGIKRASFNLQADGAILKYLRPNGKPQTELYGFDGGTGLTMYDEKQRIRAVIGVEDATGPAIIFKDADGKRLPVK